MRFRFGSGFLTAWVLIGWAGWTRADPLTLRAGTHLLIDAYLIGATEHVVRHVYQPERFWKQPIVSGLEAARNPDGSNRPGSNFNFDVLVRYDPDSQRFEMVHSGWYPDNPYTPVLRESQDGIRWGEVRAILPRAGLDDRQNAIRSDRRFKAFVQTFQNGDPTVRVGEVWFSPNGRNRWKPHPSNPIFTPQHFPGCIFDGAVPYFNPISLDYGLFMHVHDLSFTFRDRSGTLHQKTHVRQVWHATSPDFKRWSPPQPLFVPDSGDEGVTQFYGMSPIGQRGDYVLAVLRVLRDDLKAENTPEVVHTDLDGNGVLEPFPVFGIGYTVLAWSRDGVHWQRDRHTDPFLEPNADPSAWDHAIAWAGSVVPVGEWLYVYYAGYRYGHKVYTDRQIGVARLRKDRFVAWESPGGRGLLRTRLAKMACDRLALNVDADNGEVRVRLLDASGRPIPGFTFADCTPIREDSLHAPVRWKNHTLGELAGQPLFIEFAMENARLFGFTLSKPLDLPIVQFHRPTSSTAEAERMPRVFVVLSEPSQKTVRVRYQTAGGTATPGEDYRLPNEWIVFAPGERWKRIPLEILPDDQSEPAETIRLTLHQPENVRIGPQSEHRLILQDDGNRPPTIEAGASRYATFPVRSVRLQPTIRDDGLPDPPFQVAVTWSQDSGPGNVRFQDPTQPQTWASFSKPGVYQLRLRGTDGHYTREDTVRVVVHSEETPAARALPIQDLIAWLKADGDRQLGPESAVTQWFDQSGNGHRFEQAQSTRAPRWDPKALNGKPALAFDGKNDSLQSRWPQISAGGRINTRTIVVLFRTGADLQRRQILFKQGNQDLGLSLYVEGGNVYLGGFNVRAGWKPTFLRAPIAPNTTYWATLIYNGPKGFLEGYLNRRKVGRITGVSYLWGYGYWTSLGGVQGGARFHDDRTIRAGDYFSGWIAQLFYYDRALSDSELAALSGYLLEKIPQ